MSGHSEPGPRAMIDAYAPAEMARRVETAGVSKGRMATAPLATLSVLAGAFIAFGAMTFTMATTDSGLGFGVERIFGGLTFSLGLVLVVVAGAELFTGNSLVVMAWASRKITTAQLLRNWGVVYVGNLVGSVATALIMHWSGALDLHDGAVAEHAVAIARGKAALPFAEAFLRGVLCNVLVCLAVWMCFAAHSVSGKVLAIVFPITAFVALGFEHSVANMYFLPIGLLAEPAAAEPAISYAGAALNIIAVTLGNIVGGGVMVAAVYWVVYLRTPASGG